MENKEFEKTAVIGTLEEVRTAIQEAMDSVLEPKYKNTNRWDETPEMYQKWKLKHIQNILMGESSTRGARIIMAYLWTKIDHPFNVIPKCYWKEYLGKGGELDFDPEYKYYVTFKQSDLARELGMTNKGVREILESIKNVDHVVQRHPHFFNYWIFNGEAVTRSYEK